MEFIALAAQFSLGAVFLVSALPKVLAPRRVIHDIRSYGLLPADVIPIVGYVLGPLELLASVFLLSDVFPEIGAIIAGCLIVVFMGAVGFAIVTKKNLSCACFGLLYRERVGWTTLFRDAFLLAIAALALAGTPTFDSYPNNTDDQILTKYVLQITFTVAALGLAWVSARGWPLWFVWLVRHRRIARSA